MAVESVTDSVDKAVISGEDNLGDTHVASSPINKPTGMPDMQAAQSSNSHTAASNIPQRKDPPAPPFPEVLREDVSLENLSVQSPSSLERDRDALDRKIRALTFATYAFALLSIFVAAFSLPVCFVTGILSFAADVALTKTDKSNPHTGAARMSGIGLLFAIFAAISMLILLDGGVL